MNEQLFREIITVVIVFGGACGSAFALVLFLARHTLRRVIDKLDKMPEPAFFEMVERKLESLPDPTRLAQHYADFHNLRSETQAIMSKADANTIRVGDHETRIRFLESMVRARVLRADDASA